jgi:hypothetical protein
MISFGDRLQRGHVVLRSEITWLHALCRCGGVSDGGSQSELPVNNERRVIGSIERITLRQKRGMVSSFPNGPTENRVLLASSD